MYMPGHVNPFASGTVAAGALFSADTASTLYLAHLIVAFFALGALVMGLSKLTPRRRRVLAANAMQPAAVARRAGRPMSVSH